MKHYKKQDGSVWAFESDGSQDDLITVDMVLLTQAELEAIRIPPPSVPQAVTPLQARKALRSIGLLATVNTMIAAADEETQEAWEYATAIERQSPIVATLAAGMGLTDQQLDDLFIRAASFA